MYATQGSGVDQCQPGALGESTAQRSPPVQPESWLFGRNLAPVALSSEQRLLSQASGTASS